MKCSTQMALAVGAGYLLGRRRKMKLAVGLGAAAVTGGFGGATRKLLSKGTGLAGSSGVLGKLAPDLTEVTDMVRGDLMDVGKAAALAAVRGQINRVSDRLHEQAEGLRQGRDQDDEPQDEREDDAAEPEDLEETDAADDTEEPEDLEETDEAEESDDAEEPEKARRAPARTARRTGSTARGKARATAGSAPVRRTRR